MSLKQKGFTAVKLLIIAAAIGIIAAYAVPSISRIIQKGHLASSGVERRGAIELTQSEAVTKER